MTDDRDLPEEPGKKVGKPLAGGEGVKKADDSGVNGRGQKVRQALKANLGDDVYSSWFHSLEFASFDAGTLVVTVPVKFLKNWLETHYLDAIQRCASIEFDGIERVEVKIRTPAPTSPVAQSNNATTRSDKSHPSPHAKSSEPNPLASTAAGFVTAIGSRTGVAGLEGSPLDPRYTFDSFVVGKANELAYNAARTVAEGGPIDFNPLFLHGTTGLGKTHLMHAIGWQIRSAMPGAKVVYMSAEKFMVEFVSAMRDKDTLSFKQKLRTADLLMIDDVQFIAGKDSTQEEFFHTMNEIISAGKRLVITADRSPQNLEGIENRILSRLAWGLVADINPADYELRLSILLEKMKRMPGATVGEDVIDFLARKITSNVRELEGALNRIVAYSTLVGKPIDLDFARQVLADVLKAHDRKVTIDEIQRKVADYYAIKLSDLLSARRAREVARPRQVAMFLAKRLTPRSLPDIGRRFGGRDHTTVMHAVKRIEELRADDSELDADITRLTRIIDA